MSESAVLIGRLNRETLTPRLRSSDEVHQKLAVIMREDSRFKILGEFRPPKGPDKIFKQIKPIEGQYAGQIISVCVEHIITDEGAGSKEGPASKVGAVPGLAVA